MRLGGHADADIVRRIPITSTLETTSLVVEPVKGPRAVGMLRGITF